MPAATPLQHRDFAFNNQIGDDREDCDSDKGNTQAAAIPGLRRLKTKVLRPCFVVVFNMMSSPSFRGHAC